MSAAANAGGPTWLATQHHRAGATHPRFSCRRKTIRRMPAGTFARSHEAPCPSKAGRGEPTGSSTRCRPRGGEPLPNCLP
eukprot:15485691-Alexandrium_andersonii.AAC.1